jgi:hypothetical protein
VADETRLRVNSENAVYEEVDGELIVIDLGSGSYYSLSGSGPAIWQMLVGGASAAEIGTALEARFDAALEEIEAAVGGLIARLRENELIVAADEAAPPAMSAEGNGAREPFQPPVFERYTDMKDYFLLDPIHEVDPAGWPKPAA